MAIIIFLPHIRFVINESVMLRVTLISMAEKINNKNTTGEILLFFQQELRFLEPLLNQAC